MPSTIAVGVPVERRRQGASPNREETCQPASRRATSRAPRATATSAPRSSQTLSDVAGGEPRRAPAAAYAVVVALVCRRLRRARAAASPARARRSGSSSGARRRSAAGSGCGRSARRGRRPRRAVGGEHAVLVLAAEQRDLDLLALVLVRVVLHAAQSIRARIVTNGRPRRAPLSATITSWRSPFAVAG